MSDNESITPAGPNVYETLGVPDSEGMRLRAQLAVKIAAVIDRQGIAQSEAAALIGMAESEFSAMLRGQFRDISYHKMMDCLLALGEDVTIDVTPAPMGVQARLSVKMPASKGPRPPKSKVARKRPLRESA